MDCFLLSVYYFPSVSNAIECQARWKSMTTTGLIADIFSNFGYLNILVAIYKTKKATQNLVSGLLNKMAKRIQFSA